MKLLEELKAEVPKYIYKEYGNCKHDFKAAKRRELREAAKAVNVFMAGGAYFPDDALRSLITLLETVKDLKRQLSVKKWGR